MAELDPVVAVPVVGSWPTLGSDHDPTAVGPTMLDPVAGDPLVAVLVVGVAGSIKAFAPAATCSSGSAAGCAGGSPDETVPVSVDAAV